MRSYRELEPERPEVEFDQTIDRYLCGLPELEDRCVPGDGGSR